MHLTIKVQHGSASLSLRPPSKLVQKPRCPAELWSRSSRHPLGMHGRWSGVTMFDAPVSAIAVVKLVTLGEIKETLTEPSVDSVHSGVTDMPALVGTLFGPGRPATLFASSALGSSSPTPPLPTVIIGWQEEALALCELLGLFPASRTFQIQSCLIFSSLIFCGREQAKSNISSTSNYLLQFIQFAPASSLGGSDINYNPHDSHILWNINVLVS